MQEKTFTITESQRQVVLNHLGNSPTGAMTLAEANANVRMLLTLSPIEAPKEEPPEPPKKKRKRRTKAQMAAAKAAANGQTAEAPT